MGKNQKFKPLMTTDKRNIYCPICGRHFQSSNYLVSVFGENPNSLWFANMVTHYRHHHIKSWNRCWGYGGNSYRRGWFKNYDTEKRKINERAKRQIIRMCSDFMKANGIDSDDLLVLNENSKETRDVIFKYFPSEHNRAA